ncbi:recombinase family protein [Kocuria sp. CPCC 205300]|uniref:recombinase family protein n=1 Tax=Kocuria sabuli TaxID=3071448 RepID=UPI0036D8DD76
MTGAAAHRGARSTRQQDADRQLSDLLNAGVRRDDLYVGHGMSGAPGSRPQFDRAVAALEESDTLVITTLDRLGRSTQNMLSLAEALRERVTDSVAKRRAAGKDLGGRRQTFTDSQIRNALRLIGGGEPATQVARDLGMSRATPYRRIRELPTLTT